MNYIPTSLYGTRSARVWLTLGWFYFATTMRSGYDDSWQAIPALVLPMRSYISNYYVVYAAIFIRKGNTANSGKALKANWLLHLIPFVIVHRYIRLGWISLNNDWKQSKRTIFFSTYNKSLIWVWFCKDKMIKMSHFRDHLYKLWLSKNLIYSNE